MKVGHNEKAEDDGDDAKKLNAIVGADAMGDIIGDFLIKENTGAAGGENEETDDESANAE